MAVAQKRTPVRKVEIIVMAAPAASAGGAPAGATAADADQPGADLAKHADFRAHDLNRQWVAFDMGGSFASSAGAGAAAQPEGADPFAHVGVAQLGPVQQPAGLPPPPVVAIPPWMQSGFASSPAATRFVPGCSAGDYRPSGILARDAEGRRFGYYAMMSNIACEYGIPVGLFDAMIIRESRYQAGIFSPKNAFGLTQLMPETAAWLGVDRYDVEQNLRGGARYLRQQLDRFGQVHLALAAYNAGPGRVRNGMLPRIAETQAYVENVLLNWRRLAGLSRIATIQSATAPTSRPLQAGRVATISSY